MAVAKYIRTPYNYKHLSTDHENIDRTKHSLTQPDMNLTVRELLTRFTTGNLPDISKTPLGIEGDEELTFDMYSHIDDPDYDLADATRDKLVLMEKKLEVDKAIQAKEKLRKELREKEMREFEAFKKLKESGKLKSAENKSEA